MIHYRISWKHVTNSWKAKCMKNVYVGYRWASIINGGAKIRKDYWAFLYTQKAQLQSQQIFSRFQTIATKPLKHWSIILKMPTKTFEAYIQQHFIGLLIFSEKSTLIKLCTWIIMVALLVFEVIKNIIIPNTVSSQ